MDKTKSSVVKTTPKPVTVFYVWYGELCRRLNLNPAPAVKPAKPKCQTVLDFVGDRLKVEDWSPVLNALRQDTSLHAVAVRSRLGNCQFLHEANTEEKARGAKRKYGCLWTAYVLKQLLKSISSSLRSTQVLTYLELDGLPLFMQYLEPLLQALKKNKTLKTLSFANCSVQDSGCSLVCSYLRFTPNIEVLNLSGCNLSPVSGEHLAKLIKYQQINRYCESWHSSLRYENPDSGKMRGIKRISINCNPYFGDAGLNFVLDELEDDLWVKALDMQKCGLTDNIAPKLLDIVDYNKTLEIVDLRQNDLLNISTTEKIIQLLKQRQQYGIQPEFQWCATAVTLTWSSVYSCASKSSITTSNHTVHKSKSAPIKSAISKTNTIRKTRTVEAIETHPSKLDTKKRVLELNDKLQKEIQKRKEIEKKNQQLQCQLHLMRTSTKFNNTKTNGFKKDITQQPPVIIRKTTKPKTTKNGFHVNDTAKNNNIYNILEKLLSTGQPIEPNVEEETCHYFTHPREEKKNRIEVVPSVSNSQMSLYKYMEALKTDKT